MAAESTSKLKSLMETVKVDARVITYLMEYGLESISDLAGFFTKDTYADGVVTDVLNLIPDIKADPKTLRLQTARLRSAWQLAEAETTSAVQKHGSGDPDGFDWDHPLDPDLKATTTKNYEDHYHLKHAPECTPSDSLFGRVYREFNKRTISLYPLYKVRTTSNSQPLLELSKKRKLGNGISLTLDADEPRSDTAIVTALQLLLALQTLCVAWAMAGMPPVPSKLHPGTTVKDAELSDCLAYHTFVMVKIMSHYGPEDVTISWVLERDMQTRLKAIQLY